MDTVIEEKREIIESGLKYGVRYIKDDSVVTRFHEYEGIEEYLFFEISGRFQVVTKSLLELWGINENEAFDIAEKNTDTGMVKVMADKLKNRTTL